MKSSTHSAKEILKRGSGSLVGCAMASVFESGRAAREVEAMQPALSSSRRFQFMPSIPLKKRFQLISPKYRFAGF